jgi:hypothetical protein
MKITKYCHKSGDKIIAENILTNVEGALMNIAKPLKKRCAPDLRQIILGSLRSFGWSDKVRISSKRGLTLTAMNGKIALCLQTGNMARFYADLLKLQAQFVEEKIEAAIYILPVRDAANQMGENMANYERLTSELKSMFSKVITIPMIVIGFDEIRNGGVKDED